jgi:hypothetical protein
LLAVSSLMLPLVVRRSNDGVTLIGSDWNTKWPALARDDDQGPAAGSGSPRCSIVHLHSHRTCQTDGRPSIMRQSAVKYRHRTRHGRPHRHAHLPRTQIGRPTLADRSDTLERDQRARSGTRARRQETSLAGQRVSVRQGGERERERGAQGGGRGSIIESRATHRSG